MEEINFSEKPSLRDPIMIGAFAGWNDAAGVATASIQFLIQSWSAVKFATIDPEEFYVFTRVRPHVVLESGSYRRIEWPANDFFYHVDPTAPNDFILFSGIEPQLKWKTFTRIMIEMTQECRVSTFVNLGGLLGDVAHTLPAHLTGTATDPELLGKLKGVTATGTRYQGPTGIVGVLNSACRDRGLPTATIWGSVPHYLSGVANPRVTRDILRALDGALDLKLNLRSFNKEIAEFDSRVADAVARNSELAAYVRQIEARDRGEEGAVAAEEADATTEGAAGTDNILKELEDFLKQRREESDQEEA